MLSNVSFKHSVPPELVEHYADYPNVNALIAFDTNTGVRIGMLVYSSFDNIQLIRLLSMVVSPEYRRSGIATELLKVLSCQSKHRIVTMVEDSKDSIIGVLYKLGFVYAGVFGKLDHSGKYPPRPLPGLKLEYLGEHGVKEHLVSYDTELAFLSGYEDDIVFNIDGPK